MTPTRKYYIDNLRTIAILMLFPYHTLMIYNNFGERFYINGAGLPLADVFINVNWVWMMPLLFVAAGISTRFSLKKRTVKAYAKERFTKLFVPLVFGLLLLIPVQAYLADLFHTGQANYLKFFTTVTDFSGADGAFTPGQLWFIFFLFVISFFSLPFIIWFDKKGKGTDNRSLIVVILMGVLPCIGNSLLSIGGKSPTEYLVYFLLGYFVLSSEKLLEKLDNYRFLLTFITVALFFTSRHFDYMFFEAVSWLSVLAILGLGRHYLNLTGRVSGYLSKSSFGVYLFHQTWLVIIAFTIFKLTDNYLIQIPVILILTIALTYLTYEITHRFLPTRWMFGLK
jgi:surface polysaccharide O-acyltransferase-like enzyme